ncbi:TetR/AcrR family transcriptional regulator [Geodermatophilus ruber]|uniref:Transcriptional regulator, TetR family n=1 Tax=Geodermatophilus ruber TaxID=504800 RepID=A0A1I4BZD0_9ACTN|nr:TetR/AcrR family transcriptional regulator [Geodermatophilus ruber]SFK73873.1 transcriptional regulator, TetR family [Geodermatophilus ruber]
MADRTDGVSRRAQIIDVAARLFEQRGYHETSMEALAQEVGIRKASLYYYFSNKDLILVEIHEEMIDHLLVRARERAGSPVERLDGIMFDLVSLMELYPGRLRIFFEHYRELPAEQRRAITVKRDEYHGLLLATLRDGVAEGAFVIEDIEVTALAILGMCNWTYQWLRPGGPLGARQVADRFLALVLEGIRAPSATAAG